MAPKWAHGLNNLPGHCELRECLDPEPVDERHPVPLPLLRRVRLKGVEVTLVNVPDDVQAALKGKYPISKVYYLKTTGWPICSRTVDISCVSYRSYSETELTST